MQRNSDPDFVRVHVRLAVPLQQLDSGIAAFDFKALRSIMPGTSTHVVADTCHEEQRQPVGGSPIGVLALSESFGVEVDAEAVG